MKTLSRKKIRGFALMEVLLAVTVLALASFGVYKLYTSASESSKATQTIETLTMVQHAYNEVLTETGVPGSIKTLFEELNKKLPAGVVNAASNSIMVAYGPMTATYAAAPPFTLTSIAALTKKSARRIAVQCLDIAKKVSITKGAALAAVTSVKDIDDALNDAATPADKVQIQIEL